MKVDPLYGHAVLPCDLAGFHRYDYPDRHGNARCRLCNASRGYAIRSRLRGIVAAGLFLLALVVPGCVCVDTSAEVSSLRRLHAEYRAAVVPLPHLDPRKVDALGQRIDDGFAVLEQIERGE